MVNTIYKKKVNILLCLQIPEIENMIRVKISSISLRVIAT